VRSQFGLFEFGAFIKKKFAKGREERFAESAKTAVKGMRTIRGADR
jgi:hypothetical protein